MLPSNVWTVVMPLVGCGICLWVGYFNFCAKVGLEQTFEFGIISFGRIYQTMNFGTASPQYSKLILVTHLKNPDVSSVKTIGVCKS